VPVYYGCKNLTKYFPDQSYVYINIEHPEEAIQTIKQLIANSDWATRLPFICEARELVLNKYQVLAGASNILRQIKISEKKLIVLKPVKPGITKRISNLFAKLIYKNA